MPKARHKKMNNKHIVWLVLILLNPALSCRHNHSPAPLEFKAYEGNPVLVPGEQGSWDDLGVGVPNIVWHDSVFYLFYMGRNIQGSIAIGLATSYDGVHFMKLRNNPILAPDDKGFDAFTVGPGIVVKDGSVWVMYYNALETAGFNPGPSIGRATAFVPTGPWTTKDTPVLTAGSKGEWDGDFVIPSSVVALKSGNYIMYYTGGDNFVEGRNYFTGMATSTDGISWKKYNDPSTTQHPFEESDPVFVAGKAGDWDSDWVWMANVSKFPGGFRMFYTGSSVKTNDVLTAIGYATSKDGINWERFRGNPVFTPQDDPFTKARPDIGCIENPTLLTLDSTCFLYYDYGNPEVKIGVAVGSSPDAFLQTQTAY